MATLSEMLIGQASDVAKGTGAGLNESIAQGAQLAQTVQNIQAQREQIEQRKQELQFQKVSSVMETLKGAAETRDPKLKKFMLSKIVPGKVQALGLDNFFSPDAMEMVQTSDAALQKVLGLQLDLDHKVQRGELTGAEALKIAQTHLTNPEELSLLDTDNFFKAQQFAASEEGRAYRAKLISDKTENKDKREDVDNLRKELTSHPVSKESVTINGAFDRVSKAFGGKPSAAGDLSGIFGYMRLLDPGSTVREGEFANAQNAAGVDDRIRNLYNNAINGERLSSEQRLDFLTRAKEIKTAQDARQESINKTYADLAKARGYKPEEIISGMKSTAKKKFSSLTPAAQKIVLEGLAKQRNISIEAARKELEGQ